MAIVILAISLLVVIYLVFFSPSETKVVLPTATVTTETISGLPTQLPSLPDTDEKRTAEALAASSELTPIDDAAPGEATPPPRALAPMPDWMSRVQSIPQNSACPEDAARNVPVANADQLSAALADARPGDRISLIAGQYAGAFTIDASGSQGKRIWICGPPAAVIDAGNPAEGTALHITGDYIGVWGLTVANARQGIVVDGGNFAQIDNVEVHSTGDAGISFQGNAVDGLVQDSRIHHTGLRGTRHGNGIAIGSSPSIWAQTAAGKPDQSDRARIARNKIWDTGAESIVIHAGVSGGNIEFNALDGTGMTAAIAWVNIMGSDLTIRGNTGVSAPQDGFQTHTLPDIDSGTNNQFISNTVQVGGPGYGFYIQNPDTTDNAIACMNIVTQAGSGFSNLPCVDRTG